MVVKGLARRWAAGAMVEMESPTKCVDASLFELKSGYSPMTGVSVAGQRAAGRVRHRTDNWPLAT
jgi:hypothetical protein